MSISTRNLKPVPGIDALRRALQAMAMLDAILSPEWQYRYYSFNSKWSAGEQMGSMRNGSGDEVFVLFSEQGCFIKGFDHESPMSPYAQKVKSVWPGVLDSVPSVFESGLKEPAFGIDDTTFCIWRRYSDKAWQRGNISFPTANDPDGSKHLLWGFDGKPSTYHEFAEGYYERPVNLSVVAHIFEHKPLTEELVRSLNADLSLSDVGGDVIEVGYP